MSLPSTGELSFLAIRTELAKSGAIDLNNSSVRGLAGKASSSHSHTFSALSGALVVGGLTLNNCSDSWLRTYGATGLYNETYGGGIYMEDTTWVRVYSCKSFYVNGAITATGNITGTSDRNLKENLVRITGVLDKIKKISGYKYNFITDDSKKVYIGMMAQDWEKDFSELVETDPNGKKSLAYMNTTAVILEAIKELDEKVENLKKLL